MFNKKAIIKDYKKNLAMLSNKNFYKSVKRFMEMNLSDKSRIEIIYIKVFQHLLSFKILLREKGTEVYGIPLKMQLY